MRYGPILAAIAFCSAPSWAQDGVADGSSSSTERIQGDDADRSSYREAIERYSVRMQEFRQEVLDFIDQIEDEERQNLLRGFEVRKQELENEARQRRQLAIGRFEGFRKKYPIVILF